ncbi:MAG: hypothetical protein ACOX5A_02770 [Aminivibrio sp.]|nr:hypothetical protein [Synergistaceae bacterium]
MSRILGGKQAALAVAVCLILVLTAGVCFGYSHSGSVNRPVPYGYTVKCNPGDVFTVSVTSSHETIVEILALTPLGTEWARNRVSKSPKGTNHHLEYTAPGDKPKNNAAYWHYKVQIHAAADKKTDFSLNISQRGTGEKNRDEAYAEQAKKQIDRLGEALSKKRQAHSAKSASLREDLEIKKERIVKWREKIRAEKAELNELFDRIDEEPNDAVRSDMTFKYEKRRSQLHQEIDRFNDAAAEAMAVLDREQAELQEIAKIDNLLKPLAEAYSKGDLDRCVLILNGSDLARSMGWLTINR